MTTRRRHLAAAAGLCVALSALGRSATPTYYPDDPLLVDPETRNARDVHEREISDPYDFVENTFLKPGDHTNQRAVNVNTIELCTRLGPWYWIVSLDTQAARTRVSSDSCAHGSLSRHTRTSLGATPQ